MKDEIFDSIITAIFSFFAFIFLALQIYFHCQGNSHMMTLMCGLCLMCTGVCAGWSRANKKGGDN